MLKKHADRFAHNSTIEVYPEIEWSGGSDDGGLERSAPAANDESAALEPGPA